MAQAFYERLRVWLSLVARYGVETLRESIRGQIKSVHDFVVKMNAPQTNAVEQVLELVRDFSYRLKLNRSRRTLYSVNVAKDASQKLTARTPFRPPRTQRLQISEQDFQQILCLGQKLSQDRVVHKRIVKGEG